MDNRQSEDLTIIKSKFNFSKPDIILFICQVLLIFVVVCVSLINLSFQWGNQNLWTVVLTGSLGYIMPNPKIKFDSDSLTQSKTIL